MRYSKKISAYRGRVVRSYKGEVGQLSVEEVMGHWTHPSSRMIDRKEPRRLVEVFPRSNCMRVLT